MSVDADMNGGHPVVGESRTLLREKADRLLVERLKAAFWLVLFALGLYALRDVRLMRQAIPQLYLIKLIEVGALVAMRLALGRAASWRRAVPLAVLAVTSVYVMTAASAILRQDIASTPLAFTLLTIASAALLPWGLRAQLASVLVATVTLLWNVDVVTGSYHAALGYPGVAMAIASIASLYVAYELERHRLTIEESTFALRASEERYRLMAENATDIIVRFTPAGVLRYISPACRFVMGYDPDELVGRDAYEVVHPDDIEEVRNMHAATLASAGIHTASFRTRRKDGGYVWVETTSRSLRSPETGDVQEILAVARDITERRRSEETLRRSEERYRQLFENANDIIYTTDLEGNLSSINRAAERLTGYTQAEALSVNISQVVAPEHLQLLSDTTPGNYEADIITKDGRRVTLDVYAQLICCDGAAVGWQGIGRDVTERKRVQEELRKTKDAAEAANRAKSEFVANMSHEIRTPMNGIIGMTELALNTDLTAEQREYLEMVKTSADSLLQVINDILDFSKIEAGKLDLEPGEFNLHDNLQVIMKTLAVRAQQKQLDLAWNIAADVPTELAGDVGRLRQILVNLVGNAIKFTERGGVVVDVSMAERGRPSAGSGNRNGGAIDDRVELHFSVRDTGIGIPADKQQSIFEAFAQGDSSTARRYGGTGLGLAISSQLVELMGGRLWVESTVRQGSTFHFTARFRQQEGRGERQVPAELAYLRGLPVLVVDDNPVNRRILEVTLARWRMQPSTAGSPAAALAAMEQAQDVGLPFALILIDLHMPDIDGFALVERIQASSTLAGATIMILSSSVQADSAARCRALGIAAYLTKPVKQTELLDALLVTLGVPQPRPQLPAPGAESRAEPIEPGDSRPSARHDPLRILLAEDNVVNQKLAARLLEKCGHQVAVTSNGREAVAAWEREPFDLMLMDVQMPEMDGLEATAEIRRRESEAGHSSRATRHIPIIAMTAHAMKGDAERCLAAGMDGYVSKPIDVSKLFAVIDQVLPAAPASQPESPSNARLAISA